MSSAQNSSTISRFITRTIQHARQGDVDIFLRIFQEYFFKNWRTYVVIFVLISIAALTTAAAAWLVKDVVNSVFVNRNAALLAPLIVGVLAIFVIRGSSTYFQSVLAARISNSMVADIQNRLISHIVTQNVSFFSKNTSDSLLMRFNQGAQGFHSILNIVLVSGSRDLATLICLVVVMVLQDPILTLISLTVSPIVFFGVGRLLRRMKDMSQNEMAGYAQLNKIVRETVQGIPVIKAYNLEQFQKHDAAKTIADIETQRNRIATLQAAPVPLLDTVGGFAVALALLYAGTRLMDPTTPYDPGTFVSFLTALLLAADPARRLSQIRLQLRRSFVMADGIFRLIEADQAEPLGSKSIRSADLFTASNNTSDNAGASSDTLSEPIISFRDITFAYDTKNDAKSAILKNLDFDIANGEKVALVGPSGAGKSTIFKLLLKFYQPTSGQIHIGHHDLSDVRTIDARRLMSYVGQSNFIFSGTIRDNLVLDLQDVSQQRVDDACQSVGLYDFIASLDRGYATPVGELGGMISGGQAQRLNMARAIIRDAPILLLDEVTSSLDAENEELIVHYIRNSSAHKTVLTIAHRLSTIRSSDRILLLRDGQIAGQGSHQELVETNPYYERMAALQFAS
ncbi:MAG: ABC transporter ATP-binding protein [Pseudomonadota bacterium]